MNRIPPINCLQTFEVLARVRNVKIAATELCVTPSAISHRMRLMEQILQKSMFNGTEFSLTPEGQRYLRIVRNSLGLLSKYSQSSQLSSSRCFYKQ